MRNRQRWITGTLAAVAAAAGVACTASNTDRQALAQGFAQYQARQFDEAEAAASAYLAKYPTAEDADEAYYLRGLARLGRGDKGGAAQDLTTAIDKSRRNDLKAKAWRVLGDIAYDGVRFAEARTDYQNSLAINAPDAADKSYVNYRLGVVLQNQGLWEQARPYLDKAAASGDATFAQRARERAGLRYFTLQFGAFRDTANANSLARELKAAGIDAGVFPESHDGQTIYAVRAGGYPTWASADQAREKMLGKYPLVAVYP